MNSRVDSTTTLFKPVHALGCWFMPVGACATTQRRVSSRS